MSRVPDPELTRLARAAAPPPPSPARVADARSALLAAAAQTPQARPRARRGAALTAAGIALAAAALLAAALLRAPGGDREAPRRAQITASGRATFEHTAGAEAGEVVALLDGAIRVEVPALPAERPLRVLAGEAEVLVQGGLLEAAVRDGALIRVSVVGGRATVHRPHAAPLELGPGETWARQPGPPQAAAERPEPADLAPTAGALHGGTAPVPGARRAFEAPGGAALAPGARRSFEAPDRPPRAAPSGTPLAAGPGTEPPLGPPGGPAPRAPEAGPPLGAPPAAPPPEPPAEAAFRRGWSALQAQRWTEAAEAFQAADVPGAPVAPEAAYWSGVAKLRGGDRAGAIQAFRRLLAAHPEGARSDEAALLLGRLLWEAGQTEAARPWLERAAGSARPELKAKAEALLAPPR
jgi:TolA-binding protein